VEKYRNSAIEEEYVPPMIKPSNIFIKKLAGSNTTDATNGAGTAYSSGAPHITSVFSGVRVARSLVFCVVVYCRSLFVLLSFFFCPLCCLSFFDLWIFITPLVSLKYFYAEI